MTDTIKKVTSFTAHDTAEGTRISFTYSLIDGDGNITKSNARATIIVLDAGILDIVETVKNFLYNKIPE